METVGVPTSLVGISVVEGHQKPAEERVDGHVVYQTITTVAVPCSNMDIASVFAEFSPTGRMATLAGAIAGQASSTLNIQFKGPILEFVKFAVSGILWMHVFNIAVVEITYGWTGVFTHFWEVLFHPWIVILRWSYVGVYGALGDALPKECNWLDRQVLGENYCRAVGNARQQLEKYKAAAGARKDELSEKLDDAREIAQDPAAYAKNLLDQNCLGN